MEAEPVGCKLMEVDSSECRINGRKHFAAPALRAQGRRRRTHGHTGTLLMHVTFYFLFNVFAVVL